MPAEHLTTATKYKSLGEFAKAHDELAAKLGSAIFPPGKDASDADRARFFERIGRPSATAGYQTPDIEGVQFAEERLNAFREAAFHAGLSQGQFAALIGWEAKANAELGNAAQRSHARAHQTLEAGWGEDSVANYEKARRVGGVLFTSAQQKALGLDGDPKTWNATLVEALAAVSPIFETHPHLGRTERDVGKSNADLNEELDAARRCL